MRDEDRNQWFKVKKVFLQNCKDTHCHYCQVLITDLNRSVDHKHPIAKGGGVFDLNNLLLSCKRCNRFKSDYDYDYFVKHREEIVANFYKKIAALKERKAVAEKFHSINRSKDLEVCFTDDFFEPEEEEVIRKFRSTKVSLVRVTPTSLEFNFAETFPVEKEEELQDKIREMLLVYGTPVKAIKMYINFELTHVLVEVNNKFKVLVDLADNTEKLLSKKEAYLFMN